MEYVVRSQLELVPGSLLRIRDGRELVIYVWRGGVWITEQGDRADRFVGAGGWFRITTSGVTLVSALGLGRGTVTLTSPHEDDFAQRIELVNAGRVRQLHVRKSFFKSWASWFAPHARPTTAAL